MVGILIAILSGMLMSVQGVFNTDVTKQSSLWVANSWVQFTGAGSLPGGVGHFRSKLLCSTLESTTEICAGGRCDRCVYHTDGCKKYEYSWSGAGSTVYRGCSDDYSVRH